MKKLVALLLLAFVGLHLNPIYANSLESEVSINEFEHSNTTLIEIENLFLDFLEENELFYAKGSPEYAEYLSELLLFNDNEKVTSHPYYNEFRTYASIYLNNIEGREFEEAESILQNQYNKTIEDIDTDINYREFLMANKVETFNLNATLYSSSGYSPNKAVSYARKWAKLRNGNYEHHSSDCTNFVSQCLEAGGKREFKPYPMPNRINATSTYWYSDKRSQCNANICYDIFDESTSWIRVSDFYSYWTRFQPSFTSSNLNEIISRAKVGDIIQFKENPGDWYHSTIVVSKNNGTIYLASHTSDYYGKSIKEVKNINSQTCRIIHMS